EDGIRDRNVTGVQTCALPICYAISMDTIYPHIQSMIVRGSVLRPDLGFTPVTITASIMASFGLEGDHGVLALNVEPGGLAAVSRSEERRVGKECSVRWAREQL